MKRRTPLQTTHTERQRVHRWLAESKHHRVTAAQLGQLAVEARLDRFALELLGEAFVWLALVLLTPEGEGGVCGKHARRTTVLDKEQP